MAKPVLVVVDDKDASLQALKGDLESRYGTRYRAMSGSSPEVPLARSAELKPGGLMRVGTDRPDLAHRWGLIGKRT
jgi:hypothetical protein